jgi:galactose mutarotase-like enzyme
MSDRLRLANTHLEVIVLPGKGADIYSITDRASGIDVLFKSPWGYQDPDRLEWTGDSQHDWLARYPGGWQQLVPNAGAERERDGVVQGYHGEAAVTGWQVHSNARTSARLTTRLRTAPLQLTRTLTLDGPQLQVRDVIRNESADRPADVRWVQHPAFGAPFVDRHCRLDVGAATLISDAEAPGTCCAPDTTYDLAQQDFDLRAIPAERSGRKTFGCLTDFDSGWFSITSPTAGFGIRLDWDAAVFPHAWFWQECNATAGYPWFGEAYVIAVEPANVIPGDPSPGRPDRGIAPTLPPGAEWVSELSLTRIPLPSGASV